MWINLSDNKSNGSVIPEMAQPVPASGQTLLITAANTDATVTVEAGATYVFTAM